MSDPVPDLCARCGTELLEELPAEGHRYSISMRHETTAWRLRLTRFRFRWLPEHPGDRVTATSTDLMLCNGCAAATFMFAQGKDWATDG